MISSAGRGRRRYASLLLRRPLSEAARRRRRLQHPPVIIIAVDTTTTSTAYTANNNSQSKAHHSLVVTTTIPVRHFTPEAYRYKRRDNDNNSTSTTKQQQQHNNRKHPKNGLLTSSQRAAAAAADQSTTKQRRNNNKHHGRFLTREHLRALQKECYRLTINYHRTLFPTSSSTDDPQKSVYNGAADLFTALDKLHEQCITIISSNNNTISLQTLYQTEEAFRHICKLLDQCISGIVVLKCKQEESSSRSMVAEKLLDGLIQLRKDRARLIRLATTHQTKQQHTEQQTKRSASILSWIRDIFVVSGEQQQQNETQQDKQQQLELIAHEDEAFGPSTSTINSVITTVYHEFSDNVLAKVDTDEQQQDDKVVVVGLSPEQMLDRANRMSRLLETMRQLNLQPRASTLGLVLKAHEAIGTVEAALKAEKLYSYFPEEGAFAPLLYAFRDAALYEQSKSKRGEAAKRAHELVIKREQTVEGGARKVATHYKILLETYANAGSSIVPDVCERAEFLLQRLVGTKAFSSVVNFDPDSPVSIHEFNPALLHSLILIYADSGDKDKIERAMNVLRYMEYIRDHRSGRTAKQDHPKPLPDVFTYNALLKALKYHPQRSELDKDLVERMTRNVASWPNQQTFQQVKFDVNDSPEEWLSMLETRRGSLNPTDRDVVQMDTSVYHWALGRLRYKAKDGGGVEAARRGVRLVDSMEAQSGVADLSIASLSNMSVFEQDVASSVYNEKLRPTVETYNLILAACNFVTVESDKEEAFAIANDMYRRIGERGLSPDKSTFKLYLWCCTNLVESTESRRAKVEEVAKHAIKTKQIPKGLGAVLHQNNLPHLLKELNAEETVSS